MYLKILAHPVFVNLNFHMPMIVDLSHPLIMLQGENGSGKSTLLHSIYYALRGQQVDGYIYRLDTGDQVKLGEIYLFDAEAHNPRTNPEFFKDDPRMHGVSEHGQPRAGDAEHVPRELSRSCRMAPCCCWTSRRWRFPSRTSGAF